MRVCVRVRVYVMGPVCATAQGKKCSTLAPSPKV